MLVADGEYRLFERTTFNLREESRQFLFGSQMRADLRSRGRVRFNARVL